MKLKQTINEFRGFTFIELLMVITVVILAGGCCCARFSQEKIKDQSVCCNCNLKQVGLAFRMWSDDNNGYPMRVSTNKHGSLEYVAGGNVFPHYQCVSNELTDPKLLICPADSRIPAINFADLANTNISYFVGLDADETMPQMLLAGDRNLTINGVPVSTGLVVIKSTDTIGWDQTMHRGRGNVTLADGSVQGYTSLGAQRTVSQISTNIMRLAFP